MKISSLQLCTKIIFSGPQHDNVFFSTVQDFIKVFNIAQRRVARLSVYSWFSYDVIIFQN